jgi:CBS domain-containing protein
MSAKNVGELMVPLDDYAVVSRDATLVEAIRALRQAEQRLRPPRQPARAVLVADADGTIVGQVGHLEMLQALEPRYGLLGDLGTLSRAGVSEELFSSVIDHLSFWRGDLKAASARARNVKVCDVMRPIAESISEDTPLSEAIHKIVIGQTMRALVTRGSSVVGVLRLADLLAELADLIDPPDARDGSAHAGAAPKQAPPGGG